MFKWQIDNINRDFWTLNYCYDNSNHKDYIGYLFWKELKCFRFTFFSKTKSIVFPKDAILEQAKKEVEKQFIQYCEEDIEYFKNKIKEYEYYLENSKNQNGENNGE